MRTVLVRHGETEWSASGRHTSRSDLQLTETGRERAIALGSELRGSQWQMVLSSPMRRARETCELAGLGHEMAVHEELHEWDYGEYEGLTTPEIREQRPDWSLWSDGCPGGESPEQVAARADQVLDFLRRVDGDCVLFAHGHILRVIAARWIGQPAGFGARLALSTGTISILGFERDTEVVSEWNRR